MSSALAEEPAAGGATAPAAGAAAPVAETVFYDGGCGLCHRAVRFALWADRDGSRFRFAPLGGRTFRAAVPEDERDRLPDSLVLETRGGALLTRSAAVLHMLDRLGGGFRVLAVLGRLAPPPAADALYDLVARVRFRLFARPPDWCPVVPARLRSRFDP
jgi:predicted DCC family thiol-disulfide oxidoreductase YuxK